jgi:2-methylisocitrate lyase-like PEP mutase family enzyme
VGAEVLYAPGITNLDQIRTVCASVSRPVNVVMGLAGGVFSVQQLAEAGVKRISLGSSLARTALGALMRAAGEIRQNGTFTFASDAMPFDVAWRQMRPKNA